jgi:hypothetical protein
MRFQPFFMLMAIQPRCFASTMSASLKEGADLRFVACSGSDSGSGYG